MKSATSKDLRVGSRLLDNDPRKGGRIVSVLSVSAWTDTEGIVTYNTGKRTATISFARIYTDGKARHQGFNLISNESN